MTTPGSPVPEGAYVPGTRFGQQHQGMGVDEAKAHLNVPVMDSFAPFEGFLPSIIEMFTGNYEGPYQEFHDGQTALNEHQNLLNDVSGYATAYMTANYYKRRNRWEEMTFDGQVGPVKGATLDGTGLVLTKGTWVLNAMIASDQHVDRREHILRLEVQEPDGTPWSRKEDYGEVFPNKFITRQVPHTVVVPEDGFRVRLFTYYDVGGFGIYTKIKWRGGTNLSHLSAFRLNHDVSNAVVDEDVPDVGDSEGDDG